MYFIVFPFLPPAWAVCTFLACHQSYARFARGAYRGFRRRLPISFFFHVNCWLNHLRAFHRPPCLLFLCSVLRLYSAGGGVVSRAMSAAPPAAPACPRRCSCPPARRRPTRHFRAMSHGGHFPHFRRLHLRRFAQVVPRPQPHFPRHPHIRRLSAMTPQIAAVSPARIPKPPEE